jgi:hypothetical protein
MKEDIAVAVIVSAGIAVLVFVLDRRRRRWEA